MFSFQEVNDRNGSPGQAFPSWRETRTEKKYSQGTYRACSPDETLAFAKPLMASLGITRLANITGLDRVGMPVVVAIRPNSRSLATSQGKGDTLAAATASALYESIELWHAERPIGKMCYDSWSDLDSESKALNPLNLPLKIGAHFEVNRPIEWYQGHNLFTGESTWVPYELVSMNFVFQKHKPQYFVSGSNGLASGNTYSEAIFHAMLEVIERDAWSIWESLPEPRRYSRCIDLNSLSNSLYLSEKVNLIQENGLIVFIWDITSDIGVPVYYSMVIENPSSKHWRPIVTSAGCGAHLNSEIAISRSLNEALQGRLTFISGSRDDFFPTEYDAGCNRESHIKTINAIEEHVSYQKYSQVKLDSSEFIEQDIEVLRSMLSAVGLDGVVAIDLSRDDVGVPVVKIIIEGLEGLPHSGAIPGTRMKRYLYGESS